MTPDTAELDPNIVRLCLPRLLLHLRDNRLVQPLIDLEMRRMHDISGEEFAALWDHGVREGLIPADWDGPRWLTVSGMLSSRLTPAGHERVWAYLSAIQAGRASVRERLGRCTCDLRRAGGGGGGGARR